MLIIYLKWAIMNIVREKRKNKGFKDMFNDFLGGIKSLIDLYLSISLIFFAGAFSTWTVVDFTKGRKLTALFDLGMVLLNLYLGLQKIIALVRGIAI